LRLRDVDRILLLVDARLHAIVADAMTGSGHERIVDADHRQRADSPALRAQFVELGDLFFQRAAGQSDAEGRSLETRRAAVGVGLFAQARGAGILLLLVAPDAVMRLIEPAGEVGTGVGQGEALA